jgi:exonuclease SbcD
MRVLCAGDLHIGRRSSRLGSGTDDHLVSAAAAWERIVHYAIDQEVDLVALSGDLIDEKNRFYEAIGPLEKGLRSLGGAGIPTVAVAGNHDHDVLPELSRALSEEKFHLLGLGGRWERVTFEGREGARLHVDGWSFPTREVRMSPLTSYAPSVSNDTPILSLLHGDLAKPDSSYAPLSLAELQARPVGMWLLGHIHAPCSYARQGAPTVLYPGSPQPLDPGESGIHGVWMVEFAPGVTPSPAFVSLSTVRYETVEIDLEGVADLGAMRTHLIDRVRSSTEALAGASSMLRHLSLRLRLVGRCALHKQLAAEVDRLRDDLELTWNDVTAIIDTVDVGTRPEIDLTACSERNDAAGYLARLLLSIEKHGGLEEYPELKRELARLPEVLRVPKQYRALAGTEDFEDGRLCEELGRQAGLLLDELLSQRATT